MLRFVVLAVLVAASAAQSGQYVRGQDAAILSEARYLSGDGKFGSAYDQEDGTNFKEETDADGTRRGSYSYIDPEGTRRTISYTAGKDGFKATGDHLPVAPVAPPQPRPVAPQPQYTPQPQYQASAAPQQQWNQQPQQQQWQQPQQQQPQWAQPQPQWNQQQQAAPQQWNQQPQQQWASQNAIPDPYTTTTTPGPVRNFHPPGKLSLNRHNDGFSYTFNKN